MAEAIKPLTPLARSVSLRSGVTATLLKAILRGELKQGEKLIVRKLAEQLGVSATPVRESMLELVAIGIVDIPMNQSATIRPFGPKDLMEIYHLRHLLEVEAIKLASGCMPGELLEQFASEFASLLQDAGEIVSEEWTFRAMDADIRLHKAIFQHSGSGRLVHEMGRYISLMNVLSDVAGNRHRRLVEATAEHLAIVKALQIPNAAEGARRMGEHIDHAALGDIYNLYGTKMGDKIRAWRQESGRLPLGVAMDALCGDMNIATHK